MTETDGSESSSLNDSNSEEPKSLSSILSDAGAYSLCGITAISFRYLFPNDREFCKMKMDQIVERVGLPQQVKNSMNGFLEGEGGDVDALVNLLNKEEFLKSSCLKIIEELILFAIHEGVYDARIRVLIIYVANKLRVSLQLVELFEDSVVEMLSSETPSETEEDVKAKQRRKRNKKIKRYLMIGLAGLGGGAIVGLTGGLAAPFVAAGAGALIGGASAAALGSTAGVAVIGSLFGVAGAGLTSYKMKKRVGDIEEFTFETLTLGKNLHITIAISGWITDDEPDAFLKPWENLRNTREQYCIRYESAYLSALGRALDYFLSIAVSMAAQEALKFTILSGIMAAIAWPTTFFTFSAVIDNPWGVCIRRSAEVGKHLADVLLSRQQGSRPVSLIGFSLGARVIYFCLQELIRRGKGSEGIIQDVILLGAPVSGNSQNWKPFSRIISGRIVNGYCRRDWLLKFLYRTSTATFKIAGLGPIDWKDRRMINIDLSHIVSGHMDYYRKLNAILEAVELVFAEIPSDHVNMPKCFSDLTQKTNTNNRKSEACDELFKYYPSIRLSISEPNLCSINTNYNKCTKFRSSYRRSFSMKRVWQ